MSRPQPSSSKSRTFPPNTGGVEMIGLISHHSGGNPLAGGVGYSRKVRDKPFRCLGFDPGLAITGYGVIERRDGHTSCVGYGVIRTPQKMPLAERLQTLHHEAGSIINKYHPLVIGVETLIFAKNVKTGIVVGEARGVILLAIAQAKIDLVELTPLQVKQALTTYGRAEKQQVQYMVKKVLGLKAIPRPDDAADALAIALAAEQMSALSQWL